MEIFTSTETMVVSVISCECDPPCKVTMHDSQQHQLKALFDQV